MNVQSHLSVSKYLRTILLWQGGPVIGRVRRRIYRDGSGARIGLPKLWVDSLGLRPGDEVELVFDEIVLVIPRRSAQANRVRKAMEG